MSRNTGNLSHHEELRLDYLRKNIYYLNENEQIELHYLEQRAQGLVGPSRRASRPNQNLKWPFLWPRSQTQNQNLKLGNPARRSTGSNASLNWLFGLSY